MCVHNYALHTRLSSSTSSALRISNPRLSTTASLASKLMRRSSRVLTSIDAFFQPFSEVEPDCFDRSTTREGGGKLGELLSGDVLDPAGGVIARTGLRDGEEVDGFGGLRGSVFESGEVGDMTGFRRGEPGASFRIKRPAVAIPGLVGGDDA
jgi:hypothetical protein